MAVWEETRREVRELSSVLSITAQTSLICSTAGFLRERWRKESGRENENERGFKEFLVDLVEFASVTVGVKKSTTSAKEREIKTNSKSNVLQGANEWDCTSWDCVLVDLRLGHGQQNIRKVSRALVDWGRRVVS